MNIRTRFAPSPTGFLHVGGLRTALYAYLFARKNKGSFILRIEDTDQSRYVEGALESLLNTLKLVDLDYDEGPFAANGKEIQQKGSFGPYIQSQRTEIYRKYCQELVDKKAAYHCFCTPERLDQMRARQTGLKLAPMYDRTCLNLSDEEIAAKKAAGTPFVIRQKIPHGQKLKFNDLIRGTVVFETSTIDDQVLMKSDNFPTYHLANVVDDHLMEVTHVIRGEEWLPSTPKHVLLYEAFGWQKPEFAHIPLLLNKDKTKLSKRQGDVSAEDFLSKGYIKEALINFIALLGWHPGKGVEQEIFSIDELIQKFSLENVHKAGAIFDLDKLNWFNFQWQKKLHHQELSKIAAEIDSKFSLTANQKNEIVYGFSSKNLEQKFTTRRGELLLNLSKQHLPGNWLQQENLLLKALVTIEEKVLKTPQEAAQYLKFFFEQPDFDNNLLLNEKMKVDKDLAKSSLTEAMKALEDFPEDAFDDQGEIQLLLLNLVEKMGIKNGQLLWPLRVALSGEQFSPGVFELLWALGKKESMNRINQTLQSKLI